MLPVSPASARRRLAPPTSGTAARFLDPHGRPDAPSPRGGAGDAVPPADVRDVELAARLSVLLRGL